MNLIRAANLRGIEALIEELGGDPSDLLARYHIDSARLRDPDAYLLYRNVARLIERCAVELDCPDFGLRLSGWQGLDMLGPVAVIARNTQDTLGAFQAIGRFLHVHGPALKLALNGRNARGDYCFSYRIDEPGLAQLAQSYELSLANGTRILKLLAGESARPSRIAFPHKSISPLATYRHFFDCRVDFEQERTGFDIPAAVAQRRLSASNPETLRLMEDYLALRRSPEANLRDQVRELIMSLLPTTHCSIGVVAEQLALHPRTLQRRLHDDGTSYEALLDAARRDRAAEYLASTSLRFGQIAGLLGYSEQSAFSRSCRRWFGCSPKRQRDRLAVDVTTDTDPSLR